MLKKEKGKKKTNNRLGHDPLHFGGRHGCRSSLSFPRSLLVQKQTLLGEARSPRAMPRRTERERERERELSLPRSIARHRAGIVDTRQFLDVHVRRMSSTLWIRR
jgi:hypothetical protein